MISLLHPSRGRPEKAWDTYQKWAYQMTTHLDYILSVDSSDPELQRYKQLFRNSPFEIQINDNKSVVEATNVAAKQSKGDILIYLSDDFDCPGGWDIKVLQEFAKYTGPTIIKVDDCLQKFTTAILTIPFMNRAAYNLLGYFWHPGFKSMYVDEYLYWRAVKLEILRLAPHLKFEHLHYSVGKSPIDETYKRSEANWDQGKTLFNKLRLGGFVE